ncbi:MAG: alpha/beta hydrolase [Candidatus Pacearchaeota archaeon]
MWEYFVGLLGLLRAYQGVRFFFINRRIKGAVPIVAEAQPFFKDVVGSKKVALMLHGFTSSPKEFRDLTEFLAKRKISSYVPLLPGHGTSPERLSVVKYYQWIEFVEEQVALLAQDYDEIYIIGNSFGGNLALLCSQISSKIKGVVTLGTPIYFTRDKLSRYVLFPIARRIKIFQDKKYPSTGAKKLMTNKAWSYQSVPMRSLSQLLKIVTLTKKSLSKVTKPLLVMQVLGDHLISSESADFIITKSKSGAKRVVTIPQSYHMFLIGKHSSKVHEEILHFIKNRR